MLDLTDDGLLGLIENEMEYQEMTQARCVSQLTQLAEAADEFSAELADIAQRAGVLIERERQLPASVDAGAAARHAIHTSASRLEKRLIDLWEDFQSGPWRYLFPNERTIACCDDVCKDCWNGLRERMDGKTAERVKGCVRILKRLRDDNESNEEE